MPKQRLKTGIRIYKKACKSEEYVQAAAASKIQGEDTVIITQRNAARTPGQQTFSVPQPLTLRLWLKFCRRHPVCGK